MNQTLAALCLCLSFCTMTIGQKLHTPAEIMKIMENSKVLYELGILESEIPVPDRSTKLNFNLNYRVIEGDKIITYEYKENEARKEYVDKAEEYFMAKKYTLARDMYLKALEIDPTYYKVMTYIGQVYGIEGDFDKAIEWYLKTIRLNYIDYMAHWFLADAYKMKGQLDKAVDEITIAMILNRNNPRIQKSLEAIYKLKKLKTTNWVFNPQMQLDTLGEGKVKISYNGDWLGYALVKAVWRFEPGYSESMGVEPGTFSTLEEREAFVGLINSLNKKNLKKYPEFNGLKLAIDHKMVDEYILYEVVLLKLPFVAYQLPEETILQIKDYIIQVRGKQK